MQGGFKIRLAAHQLLTPLTQGVPHGANPMRWLGTAIILLPVTSARLRFVASPAAHTEQRQLVRAAAGGVDERGDESALSLTSFDLAGVAQRINSGRSTRIVTMVRRAAKTTADTRAEPFNPPPGPNDAFTARAAGGRGDERLLRHTGLQIGGRAVRPASEVPAAVSRGKPSEARVRDAPALTLFRTLAESLPACQAIFDLDFFRVKPAAFNLLAKELYPGNFQPTPAHHFIRLLYDKGLLLRCFTQNIDRCGPPSNPEPASAALCRETRRVFLIRLDSDVERELGRFQRGLGRNKHNTSLTDGHEFCAQPGVRRGSSEGENRRGARKLRRRLVHRLPCCRSPGGGQVRRLSHPRDPQLQPCVGARRNLTVFCTRGSPHSLCVA